MWVANGARNLGVEDALNLIRRKRFGAILVGDGFVRRLEAKAHLVLLVDQQLHAVVHDRLICELLVGVTCAQTSRL